MKGSAFLNGRLVKLLKAGALLLPVLAVASCNTVQGAGQDIRNAGTWIEKKASSNK
jgi:predicted small secreted protein